MAVLAGLAGPASTLVLVVPPVVLGAGWFLLLRNAGDPTAFAAPLIVAVNAVMAMPFAMRILEPAWRDSPHGTTAWPAPSASAGCRACG